MIKIDTSRLLKNIVFFAAVIVITWLVGYSLFPFLTWLTGFDLYGIMVSACIISLILGFLLFKRNKKSKYCFFFAFALFLLSINFSNTRYRWASYYYGNKILIVENGGRGLANKWGVTEIAGSENLWYFYAATDKDTHKEIIVGMNLPNEDHCDGYDDVQSAEYHLSKETITLSIFRDGDGNAYKYDTVDVYSKWGFDVDFSKDESKTSLYEYMENNYGKLKYDYSDLEFSRLKKRYLRSSPRSKGNAKSDFTDIGPIDCYADYLKTGDDDPGIKYRGVWHLYVKSYNGKEMYYITKEGSSDYRPLTRGSYMRSGKHFNGRATNLSEHYFYVNVPFWESASSSSSSSSSAISPEPSYSGESVDDDFQSIEIDEPTGHIEYVRKQVPCHVCGGEGFTPSNLTASGRVRCGFCSGKGYETIIEEEWVE